MGRPEGGGVVKPDTGNTARPVVVTLRLYRALARPFPHEFRNVYGDNLLQTAEDAAEPVLRHDGLAGLIRLLLDKGGHCRRDAATAILSASAGILSRHRPSHTGKSFAFGGAELASAINKPSALPPAS